jgi:hypothetical protein
MRWWDFHIKIGSSRECTKKPFGADALKGFENEA